MNRFSISVRLRLGFGLLLLITALMAVTGVWRLQTLSVASQNLATTGLQRSLLAQRWTDYIRLNWVRTAASLKAVDGRQVAQLQNDMAQTSKVTSETQKQLEDLLQDDQGRALMATVGARRAAYLDARTMLANRRKTGEDIDAALERDLRPLADAYSLPWTAWSATAISFWQASRRTPRGAP